MTLAVADPWFRVEQAAQSPGVLSLTEPYVDPLLRANVWVLRGRDCDLVVDAGLGVAPLRPLLHTLGVHNPIGVGTHAHIDHIGGLHEFEDRRVHHAEETWLAAPPRPSIGRDRYSAGFIELLAELGDPIPRWMITALPEVGYDPAAYAIPAVDPNELLDEGDEVDLGDRCLTILHLPGHSPGSIALLDRGARTLYSGDVVYDGPLVDDTPEADVEQYLESMERLLRLDVDVVHGGHGPSFGRDRLQEICRSYLDRRRPISSEDLS